MKNLLMVMFCASLFVPLASGNVNAYSILIQWDLSGKTGSEASDAATDTALNLTGLNLSNSLRSCWKSGR